MKLSDCITVPFHTLMPGQEFFYRRSGPITAKNKFKRIIPNTSSSPNATSALSDKLKLWFLDDALVMIPRPIPIPYSPGIYPSDLEPTPTI